MQYSTTELEALAAETESRAAAFPIKKRLYIRYCIDGVSIFHILSTSRFQNVHANHITTIDLHINLTRSYTPIRIYVIATIAQTDKVIRPATSTTSSAESVRRCIT